MIYFIHTQKEYQNKGHATKMIGMITQCMIEQGRIYKPAVRIEVPFVQRLFLHAPSEAKRFYMKLGFTIPPAEFNAWRRPPCSLLQMDVGGWNKELKLEWFLKFKDWFNVTYPII